MKTGTMTTRRVMVIIYLVMGIVIVNYYREIISDHLGRITAHPYRKNYEEKPSLNCSCINRTNPSFPNITADRLRATKRFGMPREFFDASLSHEELDTFGVISQPSGPCRHNQAVDYLVLVLGAIKNFDVRMSIRETYGNISRIENRTLDLVFVIGKEVGGGKYAAAVHNESRTYNDILQLDYIDSYQNLTIKTVLAFRWVVTDCPQARFVVRNMDDCLLDVFKLDEELVNLNNLDIYLGCLAPGNHIMHDGKWQFKSEVPFVNNPKTYAPYILGHSMVLSTDVIEKFYYLSCAVPLVWPDDCYLGYLALLVNTTLTNHNRFCSQVIRHHGWSSNTAKILRDEWQKRYNTSSM